MGIQRSHTLITGLASLLPSMLIAQAGQYEIQGIYSPTIADARKIDIRPERIDTILPDKPVTYAVLDRKAELPARADSISPAKVNVQPAQQRLFKGYAKAGFGLYTTPLGELYYDQERSRTNGYGVHLKHFSSNGGLDDVGPSDYSFNSIDGYYKHFLRTHELKGALRYDRRRVSYYGHPHNDSVAAAQAALQAPEDAVKQIYNDLGFSGRVRSLHQDSTRIAHDVGLEVHSFSNLSGSHETNVRLDAGLSMQDGNETYGLGVLLDNNAYRGFVGGVAGDFRRNGTLLGLMPNVETSGERYRVKVGAGIYVDALGSTTFHFFPTARLSYSLFDDILVPYAGFEGERRRNSLRSLSLENPWIVGAPGLKNTSRMYDAHAGLRGSLSSRLGFDVRLSAIRMKDLPLFVNVGNAPFGDRMVPIYDQVDIFNVGGELRYHTRTGTDVVARLDVASYDARSQAEAWNLPPYTLSFIASHSLREKLIVRAEALFLGRRLARGAEIASTPDGQVVVFSTVELDGFLDLFLGLEYRYTKRFSIFLEASNLSASKYERWYRYPVQRGLLMGGATYAF